MGGVWSSPKKKSNSVNVSTFVGRKLGSPTFVEKEQLSSTVHPGHLRSRTFISMAASRSTRCLAPKLHRHPTRAGLPLIEGWVLTPWKSFGLLCGFSWCPVSEKMVKDLSRAIFGAGLRWREIPKKMDIHDFFRLSRRCRNWTSEAVTVP